MWFTLRSRSRRWSRTTSSHRRGRIGSKARTRICVRPRRRSKHKAPCVGEKTPHGQADRSSLPKTRFLPFKGRIKVGMGSTRSRLFPIPLLTSHLKGEERLLGCIHARSRLLVQPLRTADEY